MAGQKSSEGAPAHPQRLGPPEHLRLTGSGMLVCFLPELKNCILSAFPAKGGN